MKKRLSKRPLPTLFHKISGVGKLVKHEYFVRLHRHTKLGFKVLVFDTWGDMREFWDTALDRPHAVDNRTHALCSRLECYVECYGKDGSLTDKYTMHDPRYVTVMGFVKPLITTEVIAHEAVHAAFAYADRVNYKWVTDDSLQEEGVAYPTGAITRMLIETFKKDNLIK